MPEIVNTPAKRMREVERTMAAQRAGKVDEVKATTDVRAFVKPARARGVVSQPRRR